MTTPDDESTSKPDPVGEPADEPEPETGDQHQAEVVMAEQFEAARGRLEAVAYRMLGSHAEAEDAVAETWLRFSRAGTDGVENLGGWLTTIVSRVCLDRLRSRASRREDLVAAPGDLPVPAGGGPAGVGGASGTPWTAGSGADPVEEVVRADTLGPALLLVLETLAPAERLAFVLHDVFALPFDEIAPIVGRTPAATRQLASRGRRRVQGRTAEVEVDQRRQRQVVDAFLAASQEGDFDALLAVLDPEVALRADAAGLPPGVSPEARGAEVVAGRARSFRAAAGAEIHVALVDGAVGVVTRAAGQVVVAFLPTVEGDRIVEIDVVSDPERLARLQVVPLAT